MPYADVPEGSLYYEVHGDGAWLVFVHGAGGNHLSWWQQVPAFAGRFRCVVVDQRGFGRSAGAAEPARLASDLTALLDHLGASRAALVGQSMGGWTVLGCARAAPARVTHLVLTGTLAGLADDAMLAALAASQAGAGGLEWRRALAPDFPAREPARTFLYEAIAALNPPLAPDTLRGLLAIRHEAPAPSVPVTFIAGGRDRLFPLELVRRAHAKVPGAEMVIVPEAGHSAYFECADAFNRALAAALGV